MAHRLIHRILTVALAWASLWCWTGNAFAGELLPYQDRNLSSEERAKDLVSRMTLEQKVSLMLFQSPAIPELGIHQYNWWNEALHGAARAGLATVFPQSIGMAASWDVDMVKRVFDIASTEQRIKFNQARAVDDVTIYHGLTVWTPNINIFRDPRWGRGQETYGEDPYLTKVMGAAVVRGLQGPEGSDYDKLHACVKHFAVHSGPEPLRHRFNIENLPLRDLNETYLYAFKYIVQNADVKQVMCAYNAFEGKPCCTSDKLLTQILRNEWGYDNVVVTDCWAVHDNFEDYGHNQFPKDPVGAASASVRSGADMECGESFSALVQGVKEGKISEEEIDRSVTRVMKSRFDLGEMDAPENVSWSRIPESELACVAHRNCALEMARETMTLLSNDGILPLSKDKKVVVVGPNAAAEEVMLGNYNGTPASTTSILEGIRNTLGEENVTYFKGCELCAIVGEKTAKPVIDRKKIKEADAIIFVGGITPAMEGEDLHVKFEGFYGGDRTSIELPSIQRKTIASLCKFGKPVILVNLSGSAVALKPESENCNAILQAWYGGEAGGQAVADVLFGDYNPGGKLPVTFYASDADLGNYENYEMVGKTYRYFNGEALFPFGHGLSYTAFSIGEAEYVGKNINVTVSNTGDRDGDEVVQVYVRKNEDANGPRLSLRGFKRVHIPAHSSIDITIPVNFDLYNPVTGNMEETPGKYTVYYGNSSDIRTLKSLDVELEAVLK